MALREKTEITIETEHRLIIRHRRVVRRWCQNCGHETDFVPVEAALNFRQAFCAGAERPTLHLDDGESGKRLVCMESLLRAAKHALEKRDGDLRLGLPL